MKYFTYTHSGRRDTNEDSCAAVRFKPLSMPLEPLTSLQNGDEYVDMLVLSDGMGGEEHGEDVSKKTVNFVQQALLGEFSTRATLQEEVGEDRSIDSEEMLPAVLEGVVERTNDSVRNLIERENWDGAGATLVLCVVQGKRFWYIHRGDSRLYHWSDEEQVLSQLTMDHTVPLILLENGVIDPETAKHHARQNELVFFIGSEEQSDSQIKSGTLDSGDRLLLCSDGISSKLDQNRMEEILAGEQLFEVAKDLFNEAVEAGSSDNLTVVLYEYDGSPRCMRANRESYQDSTQEGRDEIGPERTMSLQDPTGSNNSDG